MLIITDQKGNVLLKTKGEILPNGVFVLEEGIRIYQEEECMTRLEKPNVVCKGKILNLILSANRIKLW